MARRNDVSSQNPFNLDDQEANQPQTSASRTKKYSNPFDDDGHGISCSSHAKMIKTSQEKNYTNPFDDGHGVSASSLDKMPVANAMWFKSSKTRVEIPEV